MKILKFGGTSLGSAERMKNVANLVSRGTEDKKLVVLSAVSGTTNSLESIGKALENKNKEEARTVVQELYEKYVEYVDSLFTSGEAKDQGFKIINEHFEQIKGIIADDDYDEAGEKALLAQGELISTRLFTTYLEEQKLPVRLLPALEFMKIDENDEPDTGFINENIQNHVPYDNNEYILITQGYICRNAKGEIDNLKRGGSDYTASLVGAALQAEEIQIWTDIDGMHNNDPRIVENTFPIAALSFEEAAELAYFGAKILHPSTIRPAQYANIPVRLLNTLNPEAEGTLISSQKTDTEIKSIAAKDGITAVKVKSTRMLMAYGFLRRVFEVFEKFKTPIDMITTSEVAVSLTIDDNTHLEEILTELNIFGEVEVDKNQTIICVVGNMLASKKGLISKVIEASDTIPLRMISYGGSRHNISMLIDSDLKGEALNKLNDGLFKFPQD